MSKTAKALLPEETDYSVDQVYAMADEVFEDDQMFASIASGSFRYDAMFVAPCSESSIAKFACGIGDTLISRAVAVCIKEGRSSPPPRDPQERHNARERAQTCEARRSHSRRQPRILSQT